MNPPSMAELARYKPRWAGVYELNIGDAWRAVWEKADELPEHAPVFYARAVIFKDDRGYVTRPAGSDERWGIVEGNLGPDETPDAFVKRAALEQTGAKVRKSWLVGFLECKATSHNSDFEPGAVTVQPLYVAVARSVGDVPADSPFERRRLPMNEFMRTVRIRYPEIERYLGDAGQRYAELRAAGEA